MSAVHPSPPGLGPLRFGALSRPGLAPSSSASASASSPSRPPSRVIVADSNHNHSHHHHHGYAQQHDSQQEEEEEEEDDEEASQVPSISSHALAWDQTYLRITYLVGTMGPVAVSDDRPPAADSPAATSDKALRKRAQIQTWCAEVGPDAFCACAPAARQQYLSSSDSSSGGSLCDDCRRPTPDMPTVAALDGRSGRGMRRALQGFRTFVLRHRKSGRLTAEEPDDTSAPPPAAATAAATSAGTWIVRTDMYRADLTPPDRRGDEKTEGCPESRELVGHQTEDDSDHAFSASTPLRGLLRTNARLLRAQRLLAKSRRGQRQIW